MYSKFKEYQRAQTQRLSPAFKKVHIEYIQALFSSADRVNAQFLEQFHERLEMEFEKYEESKRTYGYLLKLLKEKMKR
jgi:hypothetical protein